MRSDLASPRAARGRHALPNPRHQPGGPWYRRAALVVLGLVAAAGAFVGLWPVYAMAHSGAPLMWVPLIAHVTGMLAGFGVLVMLILMSRSPVLERGIGADVLARWHARSGRIVVVLVLVHGVLAVLGWAMATRQAPLAATIQVLGWPGLVAATIGTALMVLVAIVSIRAARRRVR